MNISELESAPKGRMVINPGDQLYSYILKRSLEAFSAGQKQRDGIKTPKDLEDRRSYIREEFIKCLGGLPESDSPLNAKLCGTLRFEGYRIEKIVFESRPKVYVTSNMYIPDGIDKPAASVLFLCGHHEEAKHAEEYQAVCRYLVNAGLIVLSIDPLGQGERLSYYETLAGAALIPWGCDEHEHAGEQCYLTGSSIARYFVHDAMRAFDYLCTRPEVDPEKIGVTGNSGGGTQTCMLMLCDNRFAAAAPATFIMDRESYLRAGQPQDAEQIWCGMTKKGFDHEDIILCMAPKPVLILSVVNDFFPIEATRKTVSNVKRVYELCGKPGNLEMFEDISEHCYTPAMAVKAAGFFTQHLTGKMISPKKENINKTDPSELFCTSEGIVVKDLPDARSVYNENKTYHEKLEIKKKQAAVWLKEKIFCGRYGCAPALKRFKAGNVGDLLAESCIWWSQEGMQDHAYTFRTFHNANRRLPATVALWNGGTGALSEHLDWIYDTCRKDRCVIVFDNTASGNIKANEINGYGYSDRFGTLHTLTTDLFWLDDSLCALRTYEIIKLIDVIGDWHGMDNGCTEFYTYGHQDVYAKLAGFIDPRIKKIESHSGMKSFSEIVNSKYYNGESLIEYIIPGILGYMDIV